MNDVAAKLSKYFPKNMGHETEMVENIDGKIVYYKKINNGRRFECPFCNPSKLFPEEYLLINTNIQNIICPECENCMESIHNPGQFWLFSLEYHMLKSHGFCSIDLDPIKIINTL
jgi:hypothetical protein